MKIKNSIKIWEKFWERSSNIYINRYNLIEIILIGWLQDFIAAAAYFRVRYLISVNNHVFTMQLKNDDNVSHHIAYDK